MEFALILPALLLIFMGMFTVGNYLMTRYNLTAAANQAARACCLTSVVDQGTVPQCVNAMVAVTLQPHTQRRCQALNVQPQIMALGGGMPVNVLQVNLTCTYSPAIGGRFMANVGIAFPPLITQGAMPLQQ